MRERENWDVLCEECDKIIIIGVKTESGDNYCASCYDKLAYGNKKSNLIKSLFKHKKSAFLYALLVRQVNVS